jgi:hypothetical protein
LFKWGLVFYGIENGNWNQNCKFMFIDETNLTFWIKPKNKHICLVIVPCHKPETTIKPLIFNYFEWCSFIYMSIFNWHCWSF